MIKDGSAVQGSDPGFETAVRIGQPVASDGFAGLPLDFQFAGDWRTTDPNIVVVDGKNVSRLRNVANDKFVGPLGVAGSRRKKSKFDSGIGVEGQLRSVASIVVNAQAIVVGAGGLNLKAEIGA